MTYYRDWLITKILCLWLVCRVDWIVWRFVCDWRIVAAEFNSWSNWCETDCHIIVEKRFVGVRLDTFQKGQGSSLSLSLWAHVDVAVCLVSPIRQLSAYNHEGDKGKWFYPLEGRRARYSPSRGGEGGWLTYFKTSTAGTSGNNRNNRGKGVWR